MLARLFRTWTVGQIGFAMGIFLVHFSLAILATLVWGFMALARGMSPGTPSPGTEAWNETVQGTAHVASAVLTFPLGWLAQPLMPLGVPAWGVGVLLCLVNSFGWGFLLVAGASSLICSMTMAWEGWRLVVMGCLDGVGSVPPSSLTEV